MTDHYLSPRWSGELPDCSMPMTFDTYSACSYNCLYCFAFFQRSHSSAGSYLARQAKDVNPKAIRKLFTESLAGRVENLSKGDRSFAPYIANRMTMQWGGLSDGFDEFERKRGVSLELLEFFDEIDYPLSISTKGTWWTQDERYMRLFARHAHNWHVKISIITPDTLAARSLERGVPSPQERIDAIRRLSALGIHVTLRLRPYIIGISDGWRTLVTAAYEAGADSVTTEFFCLEARANERLRAKYDEISRIAGYDIWAFYRDNTKLKGGYRRLSYEIKAPIITAMRALTHSLGMRFYVSDAHHKEKSDHCCCCGVPPEWRVSKGQFAEALQIAKEKHARGQDPTVTWSEVEPDLRTIGQVTTMAAPGFQGISNKVRAERGEQTLYDFVHLLWNTPKKRNSPYHYFEGVLYPIGLDAASDVVYRLDVSRMNHGTPMKPLPGGEQA